MKVGKIDIGVFLFAGSYGNSLFILESRLCSFTLGAYLDLSATLILYIYYRMQKGQISGPFVEARNSRWLDF